MQINLLRGGGGDVEHLLRFGYCLMCFVLLLMMWSSFARAASSHAHGFSGLSRDRDGDRAYGYGAGGGDAIDALPYPPCSFNPLCTCSKPAPDLGIMQCRNVPFPSIPNTVNVSKVFTLHVENTGLRELEPYFFQATGERRSDRQIETQSEHTELASFARLQVCIGWRSATIC